MTPAPPDTDFDLADDGALMGALAAGSESALGAPYARHVRGVYAQALAVLGDPQEAQEALQETFLRAWQRAGEYSAPRGSVQAWLLTLGRTCALDRRRRRMAREHSEQQLGEAQGGSGAHADSPESDAIVAEQSERILAALGRLSQAEQRALALHYFGGMSQLQVAAATGWPLGSVKSQLRRALLKLGIALRDEEERAERGSGAEGSPPPR
ncbi:MULTISPECIES: sigma-70 family RNA polymerase sigma factor [Myxococcaceae]|uniref:sigma-70 family RNA polymerase sigma factor n=1 Tax=Myxococcaceae TaxID=31 RepID=UPI00188FB003|nr:sigma-70 family RNA polymerase sigma factor [Simulacricoccus sp. 17bor-14]